MHFATALTTVVLAAKANAAKIEAEMNYLDQYESQYGLGGLGLGLGHGPSGPSLEPLSSYNPAPAYSAPLPRYNP